MRRVAITGMGIRSPIGNDPAAAKDALASGKSGIRFMPEWREVGGLRTLLAGTVDGVRPREIPRKFRRTMGRVAILAALAARDAVAEARLDEESLASDRAGVALGSTTGSVPVLDQFFSDYTVKGFEEQEGTTFMKIMGHSVAANVAAMLGVRGRMLAPCSACATSTQAIGAGYEAIRDGHQDLMLCGGADDLHPTTSGVFDILYATSAAYNDTPHKTPRPFDRDRDGLVVSEGAGVVVLEDYDRAVQRSATIHAELIGYASCCDPAHMTQPGRDGMLQCMNEALQCAGVSPQDLDYVNAHATGTLLGDAAEARALRTLVGDRVPVSGTKGHTGHTLAACGAMEVIFCLLMMRHGFLAPTRNLDHLDPECEGIAHVRETTTASPRLILTNNFAFGGVNASLVLARAPE